MLKSELRTIAIVTGTRAEYGLLETVMRAVDAERHLSLRVIVAGAHLATGTWRDVAFDIAAKVPMQKRGETGRAADVQSVARGVAGFGKAFEKLRPDFIVVLGDRIEAFVAATAGSIGGFRVAHIHGGDRAEGVADEAMRHAISKLSHIHFAATSQSRKRLIQMGEHAKLVYNVGSPAIDALRGVEAAAGAPVAIVMQHPVGGSDAQEREWMSGTLRATRWLDPLVMAPNGDPGAAGIRAAIAEAGITPVENLPRAQWLSTLAGATAIVGNSSAGLIEAAALRVACVNVRPRQAGREKPGNVIDCQYGESAVRAALLKAMKLDVGRVKHPYGDGRSGERIATILATVGMESVSIRKRNSY